MKLAALLPSIFRASSSSVIAEPVGTVGAGFGAGLWQRMFFNNSAPIPDIQVNEWSSLNLTSVYRAVSVIASTIAHLPIHIKQEGIKAKK